MAAHSKVVCILGMHRSGTSMLAGWLKTCGLNVGDSLLRSDFSNKAGHFEDLDFLLLHKEILRSNELDTSGLQLSKTHFELPKYHEVKMNHLIQMKNELHSQWGWKDPRTCLFIDYYLAKMPDLKIIIIHRPAQEVVQSLLKRDWERWKGLTQQQAWRGLHPKLLFQSYFKRILMKKKLPEYVRACEIYFEGILSLLRKSSSENVLAFTLPYFLNHDKEIFNTLTLNWNLNLNFFPSGDMFKPELLSSSSGTQLSLTNKLKSLEVEIGKLVNKR